MDASPTRGRPWGRAGAIIAVALAAGFLVWLLVIRDDAGAQPDPVPVRAGGGPVAGDPAGLSALQDDLGHPVYWAGEQRESRIELTLTADERVYVRYLGDDAEVGDPRPDFLTVGTYPVDAAFSSLERAARRPSATTEETPDGGLIVTDGSNPTSVYIAYPRQDLQIEVYDADPERALDLAVSGDVRPAD